METFGKKFEMNVMNVKYWKSLLTCYEMCVLFGNGLLEGLHLN